MVKTVCRLWRKAGAESKTGINDPLSAKGGGESSYFAFTGAVMDLGYDNP